jgi:hypothetical protein
MTTKRQPVYSTTTGHTYQDSRIKNNFVPKSRTEIIQTKKKQLFSQIEERLFTAEYLQKIKAI